MYDLRGLWDTWAGRPSGSVRLALVHRSFRSVGVGRGVRRQEFAAHFPALGLLHLAQVVREGVRSGDLPPTDVAYFDEGAFDTADSLFDAVDQWTRDHDRSIVAASSYTATIDQLERFLARFDPTKVLIMVGGAHATVAPDIESAHLVVRGEGAAAIRHVLTTLPSDAFAPGCANTGIQYQLDGVVHRERTAFDRSLTTATSPAYAYDLLPAALRGSPVYATNFTRMLGRRPQVYVCTQSCRARCTFCSTYLIHGRAVSRPLAKVRADIDFLVNRYGVDSIEFHDDDLLQHEEFDGLLDVMKGHGIPWFCYLRSEHVTPELARAMADAGCRRAFVGIETMDQSTLDYYNKKTTIEQNAASVTALAEAGVMPIAGFIIGAPEQTVDDVLRDLDRFLELPLFAINCSVLSPDPGTVEFQRARRSGTAELPMRERGQLLRIVPDPARFGLGMPTGLPVVSKRISKPELNRLLSLIEFRFYFRRRIYAGLTEGRTPAQVAKVRAYYRHVAANVAEMTVDEAAPEVVDLRAECVAIGSSDEWTWAMPVPV